MGISYKRLWKLLIDRDMKKRELRETTGLSASLMQKLNQNQSVTTNSLVRICNVLNCRIEDILEILPEEEKIDE
jgi:DNA-binding Xre family transcriptional regulator